MQVMIGHHRFFRSVLLIEVSLVSKLQNPQPTICCYTYTFYARKTQFKIEVLVTDSRTFFGQFAGMLYTYTYCCFLFMCMMWHTVSMHYTFKNITADSVSLAVVQWLECIYFVLCRDVMFMHRVILIMYGACTVFSAIVALSLRVV